MFATSASSKYKVLEHVKLKKGKLCLQRSLSSNFTFNFNILHSKTKIKKKIHPSRAMSESYFAVFSCCCSQETCKSPGSAGNWEPGNHAELFHHLKPICCDKKNVLQDRVGLSDQKQTSGYTERWWIIFSPPDSSSFRINQAWGGKKLMGVPWDKDAALL